MKMQAGTVMDEKCPWWTCYGT